MGRREIHLEFYEENLKELIEDLGVDGRIY
jgi:hypothetical protein